MGLRRTTCDPDTIWRLILSRNQSPDLDILYILFFKGPGAAPFSRNIGSRCDPIFHFETKIRFFRSDTDFFLRVWSGFDISRRSNSNRDFVDDRIKIFFYRGSDSANISPDPQPWWKHSSLTTQNSIKCHYRIQKKLCKIVKETGLKEKNAFTGLRTNCS